MRYIIGVDGGGTKTLCALSDETGRVRGIAQSGCSNHQLCGLAGAVEAIAGGIRLLLSRCDLTLTDISRITLGLAGADFDSDVQMLAAALHEALPAVPVEVINDVWLPLAAEESYGAVSICGTGHNTAVMTEEGRRFGISALTYSLGNFGGGRMLTQMAMHAAFRAYEGTGDATLLTLRLPGLFFQPSMKELLYALYMEGEDTAMRQPIPSLVYELAAEGDRVCLELLRILGRTQGQMTGGLIRQAGLQDRALPVVLAGSLYMNDHDGLLTSAYEAGLSPYCPRCRIRKLDGTPVVGAMMLALRALHRAGQISALEDELFLRLKKTFPCQEESGDYRHMIGNGEESL